MVPQFTALREEILKEFHYSRVTVHLGGTKCTMNFVANIIGVG